MVIAQHATFSVLHIVTHWHIILFPNQQVLTISHQWCVLSVALRQQIRIPSSLVWPDLDCTHLLPLTSRTREPLHHQMWFILTTVYRWFKSPFWCVLATNDFYPIWVSHILDLRVPEPGYSRNASSALHLKSTFLILSLSRWYCWWAISSQVYRPLNSQCFGTWHGFDLNLQFLNQVFIIKSNVQLPDVYVTIAEFGNRVFFLFFFSKTFKLFLVVQSFSDEGYFRSSL